MAFVLIPGLSAKVQARASEQGPVWDRENLTVAALNMVSARPLLGFGWSRFQQESAPYFQQSPNYPLTATGIDVHNYFFTYAVELGLVGLDHLGGGFSMGCVGALATRRRQSWNPGGWRFSRLPCALWSLRTPCHPQYFKMRPFGCGPGCSGVPAATLTRYMARILMRSRLRDAGLVALMAINHGDQHHCPVCAMNVARFMRRGGNLMCVRCRSYARHRLMVLYLQLETDLLRRRVRILHIAPEPGVHAFLSAFSLVDNVTLDVDAGVDVQVQADARDLPFEDKSFDAVLCSHVLEHIPEDVDVAREMARVLVKDGIALIQVPVDPNVNTTYETFAPTPSDREREYGQHDHVRIYAPDVEDRLGEAFRRVERVDYAATFDAADRWRMGLVEPSQRHGEDIYLPPRAA